MLWLCFRTNYDYANDGGGDGNNDGDDDDDDIRQSLPSGTRAQNKLKPLLATKHQKQQQQAAAPKVVEWVFA